MKEKMDLVKMPDGTFLPADVALSFHHDKIPANKRKEIAERLIDYRKRNKSIGVDR